MASGNNFDLISEAKGTFAPIQEILDEQPNGEFEELFTDDVIDEIAENGIYWIHFTPDFFSVRNKIRLDPWKKMGSDGVVREVGNNRKLKQKSRYTPHSTYTDLMERMLENHSRGVGRNKHPKGKWSIDVGFLDPYEQHRSPDGKHTITMGALVAALLSLGYDPLLTIRRKEYIAKIQKRMAEVIVESVNAHRSGSPLRIKSKMEKIARDVQNFAKEYIEGGRKPALDKKTIENRRYNQKKYGTSYPNGIEEPLSETEQLEASILYRVNGESAWNSQMEEFKRQSAERKRAAQKVEAQWKKHDESVAKASKTKNRATHQMKIEESTAQQERIAQKELEKSAGFRKGVSAKNLGRFTGLDPTFHRDAVFIVRGILMLTGGKKSSMQAMMDSGKILPGEALAFQAAKNFLQTQATAAGIGLREYLQGV